MLGCFSKGKTRRHLKLGKCAVSLALSFTPLTVTQSHAMAPICDLGDGAPDVSGYDTPEIRRYKCEQEFALGRAAKTRMETRLLRSIVAHWNVSSARGCGILH
jgi:hypothetical protein